MAHELEQVEQGKTDRLAVFMPPRHGKSELASIRFIAWYLGRNPDKRVILGSYSSRLAQDFGRQVRDIFRSKEFQECFPGVAVSKTSSARDEWLIEGHRGGMKCVGVGGSVTGFGADLLIIEDPIKNDKEANSITQRQALEEWFKSTAFTRLEKDAAIVLVQTRWHEQDLAGVLLKEQQTGGEKWKVIDLPAIATENEDWGIFGKRKKGEPLWASKYDAKSLARIRRVIGEYWFSSLYQQKPQRAGGRPLDSRMLMKVTRAELPMFVKRCRFWDLAFSEAQGADYVSGVLCGVDAAGNFYILDVIRVQGRWTKSKPLIKTTAQNDGPGVDIVIEANGTQLGYFQQMKDELRTRRVHKGIPDGNKSMRADMWGSRLQDGIIHCLIGKWNNDLFEEMDNFPQGEHDDQVDGVSGGWKFLNENLFGGLYSQ